MAVGKRLRFEVMRRDNHSCQYCGRSAPDVELQVDHVVPVTLGGTDHPSNLKTACRDCNSGKASVPHDVKPVNAVPYSRERMAAAFQKAAQRKDPSRADELAEDIWNLWWDEWCGHLGVTGSYTWGDDNLPWAVVTEWDDDGNAVSGIPFATEEEARRKFDAMRGALAPPIGDDHERSATSWWDAGLEHLTSSQRWSVVYECVQATRRADQIPRNARWTYFCGCMWRRVRQLQERAEQLLMEGDLDGED